MQKLTLGLNQTPALAHYTEIPELKDAHPDLAHHLTEMWNFLTDMETEHHLNYEFRVQDNFTVFLLVHASRADMGEYWISCRGYMTKNVYWEIEQKNGYGKFETVFISDSDDVQYFLELQGATAARKGGKES